MFCVIVSLTSSTPIFSEPNKVFHNRPVYLFCAYFLETGFPSQLKSLSETCQIYEHLMYAKWIPSIEMPLGITVKSNSD